MSDVFISHTEEDADLALGIAHELEQSGYTTWYFERDSLPGLAYLLQTRQAITECAAFLVILSRQSLNSSQIGVEVVCAHEADKAFLPILCDMTQGEFSERRPEWHQAMGGATSLRVPPGGAVAITTRLVAGLRALKVYPQTAPNHVAVAPTAVPSAPPTAVPTVPPTSALPTTMPPPEPKRARFGWAIYPAAALLLLAVIWLAARGRALISPPHSLTPTEPSPISAPQAIIVPSPTVPSPTVRTATATALPENTVAPTGTRAQTATTSPSPTALPPTRAPATLTPGGPTGRIGFVSKDGTNSMAMVNIDGSGRVVLGSGIDPAWSPDGLRVAFVADDGTITVMNADGGQRRKLTSPQSWQPDWSPDGRRLVFVSEHDGNRQLYLVNADGSNLRRLTNNPYHDRHPSWSPGGDRIAFISNRTGRWQIWTVAPDDGAQVMLTSDAVEHYRPVWSPDGQWMAYGVWSGTRNEIWVIRSDGSGPKIINGEGIYRQEGEGYGLTWAPSEWILFVSDKEGKPQICAMRPDGSGVRRLTDEPAMAFSPRWVGR